MATAIVPDLHQDSGVNVREEVDKQRGGNQDYKVGEECLEKSGEQNSGSTLLEAREKIPGLTLSSKLGNGDYFHNPEDLVEFVISGKN